MQGDSENIPFGDNLFDVAMVAFGVRNFADPLKGLSEMRRVIRNGGMIMVLEFSKPSGFPFQPVYNFYFRNILPFFGRLFSKDKSAYSYLPDSVMNFLIMRSSSIYLRKAGFSDTRQVKLTGGVASIYTGIKIISTIIIIQSQFIILYPKYNSQKFEKKNLLYNFVHCFLL